MRTLVFLLFLAGTLAADVVILKDGGRISGKVVDKKTHYEVTPDGGSLRTYLKEEVEKVIADPKEFLGDAAQVLEQAKAEYQAAIAISNVAEQNAKLRDTIGKLSKAREAYAATRELFPEDKYADLDQKLMQVMQLMRLLRDRLGSEIARRPDAPVNPSLPPPPPSASLKEAFAILLDPAKRADPASRASAREAFRIQRAYSPHLYEVATAAMLFLSRPDAEWRLEGGALKELQDYFAKPWLKEPEKLTPAAHQQAAQYVADRVTTLQKSDPKSSTEALSLFGIGHVGHAPIGQESEKLARLLGLVVINGMPGTAEGHVVRDLNGWIAAGDFDLAVLAWVKEHRAIDTPTVRFVWSWALLRLAVQRKRGFERPVAALGGIKVADKAVADHLVALSKSIKTVGTCGVCLGEAKLRCTNCHGKKEIRTDCEKCKGKGKVPDAGYFGTGFTAPEIPCYPCRGRGYMKLLKCEKCKDGFNDCKQCDKPRPPPALEEICQMAPCAQCDARGYVFRKILWACKGCMGLGYKLTPQADPTKTLQ